MTVGYVSCRCDPVRPNPISIPFRSTRQEKKESKRILPSFPFFNAIPASTRNKSSQLLCILSIPFWKDIHTKRRGCIFQPWYFSSGCRLWFGWSIDPGLLVIQQPKEEKKEKDPKADFKVRNILSFGWCWSICLVLIICIHQLVV